MNLNDITPVVLTCNEEANISRTLLSLTAFPLVKILDSGSTDRTHDICSAYSNVQWHKNDFVSFAAQWNHAITLVETPWMLALDADYFVTEQLLLEIRKLPHTNDPAGYLIPFRYCVRGKPLKRTLLPDRITLFRGSRTTVIPDGHTQVMEVRGNVLKLENAIFHDDRKPFSRWFNSQKKYAKLEVIKLKKSSWNELPLQDKLRKLIFPAPPLVGLYCLVYHRLFLEGTKGLLYTFERVLAELLLSWELSVSIFKK